MDLMKRLNRLNKGGNPPLDSNGHETRAFRQDPQNSRGRADHKGGEARTSDRRPFAQSACFLDTSMPFKTRLPLPLRHHGL